MLNSRASNLNVNSENWTENHGERMTLMDVKFLQMFTKNKSALNFHSDDSQRDELTV